MSAIIGGMLELVGWGLPEYLISTALSPVYEVHLVCLSTGVCHETCSGKIMWFRILHDLNLVLVQCCASITPVRLPLKIKCQLLWEPHTKVALQDPIWCPEVPAVSHHEWAQQTPCIFFPVNSWGSLIFLVSCCTNSPCAFSNTHLRSSPIQFLLVP